MAARRIPAGNWLVASLAATVGLLLLGPMIEGAMAEGQKLIALPAPTAKGDVSVEEVLQRRRSVRDYSDGPLSLAEISQLLWAAQGITDGQGHRTAPSAGALYPLELFLVAGNVNGVADGVYHYQVDRHGLAAKASNDVRAALAKAAFTQDWIESAAAIVVIAAAYERTAGKYGKRAHRYVDMEAGHAAQNLFLQAEALGLGSVVVGAFDDDQVAVAVDLPPGISPLILMPIGRR